MKNKLHPGEILKELYLKPLGIDIATFSRQVNIPEITDIANGKADITPDIALRLSKQFGITSQYWMNLQRKYDM